MQLKYKLEVFDKLNKRVGVYYSRTDKGARKHLLALIRDDSAKVITSRREKIVLQKDEKIYTFTFN